MLTVSQEFKDALKSPVKRTTGYIVLEDGRELLPDGDLQKYTIESVGGFLRSAMSKITVTLLGEHALAGSTAEIFYGVEYNDEYHYASRGIFSFSEAVYKKDSNTTTLTGYDYMDRFNVDYSTVGDYPTTLYEYLQAICSLVGVVLENSSIYNGELPVEEDYYENVGAYTVRDVLEDICEVSASYALINQFGHLELRQVTHTGETLTYDNLIEYQVGDYWGGINSLVLSRQPQNDDIAMRDEEDISSPTTRNVLDLNKFDVGYKTEDA